MDSAAGTDGAAWICGGGGGAAAAVSLAWKLEVGERYRIEKLGHTWASRQ